MKNLQIIMLVNSGLLETTEHTVPNEDAYKAFKFRKAVGKAYNAIREKEAELPSVAGVEKGKEPTEEQQKKIAELRQALFDDETDLGKIIPLSWDGWCALSNENRETKVTLVIAGKTVTRTVDTFRACEDILDGVLYKID